MSRAPTPHKIGRLLLAVGSGALLCVAFPPFDLWWAAPLAIALLSAALWGARTAYGTLLGFLQGLVFFGFTLWWAGTYVGLVPWAALTILQALYIAATAGVLTAIQSGLRRRGSAVLALLAVPLAWVLGELARSTTPYGGFPWARVAFSQADGPLVRFASIAGAPGVTFLVAASGAAVFGVALGLIRRRVSGALAASALAVGIPLACLVIALPTDGPRATVALIQGNVPTAGLDFNAQRRAVLDNHVQGTLRLAADRPADLSLVIWPENSSDIDPFVNFDANSEIRHAVDAVRAPIILGAVLEGPGESLTNASLYYRTSDGQPERYVKQHPVPFAEYIPDKEFYRHFSSAVDLVPRPFVAGDKRGAFLVDGPGVTYWALPTICFEVAYDGLMRDTVVHATDRPSLLVVQTNNATFGFTSESEQQFAISRLRAIEHGRSVAHVSTVGVSGFVNPDGSTGRISKLFTPDRLVAQPVLRTGLTVSDRIGSTPEIVAGALLALLAIAAMRRRTDKVVTVRPAPALVKEPVT